MGARAATNQLGYFAGFAAGGYAALGLALGALFAGAALAVATVGPTVRLAAPRNA
jgi:hypothetical protein